MKRAFPQKVKHVSFHTVDSDATEKLSAEMAGPSKQAPPDINRRARTSAAMIGLAISMGAYSLLLPQQDDRAMAAEPVAPEPTVKAATPSPTLEVAVLSPTTEVEPTTATFSVPDAPAIEHTVQSGQTLWQIARIYQADRTLIASANGITPDAGLQVGQVLRIPSINRAAYETQANSFTVASSQIEVGQLTGSAPEEVVPVETNEVAFTAAEIDADLKAKQDVALSRLKEKRDQLQSSLAELKSEESENLTSQAQTTVETELAEQPEVAKPTETIAYQIPVEATAPVIPEIKVSPVLEQEVPSLTIEGEAANTAVYRVQPGDTLDKIARSHGVSRADLIKLNRLSNPNRILVDQAIRVPQDKVANLPVAPSTLIPGFSPKVSLPSVPSVVASNGPLPNQAELEVEVVEQPVAQQEQPDPATVAYIPVPRPPAVNQQRVVNTQVTLPGAVAYRVGPGDTLDAIARRHGISRTELVRANRISNPNLIKVDQVLSIPTNKSRGSVQTVAALPRITDTPTVPSNVPVTIPVSQAAGLGGSNNSNTVVATAPLSTSPFQTNQAPEFNPDRQYSPYVERLRDEVMQLRSKYQTGTVNVQVDTLEDSTAAIAPAQVAPAASTPSQPARQINPEFSPSRHTETLQAEVRTLQEKRQPGQPPAQVSVPTPAKPVPQQQLVAAAPVGSESYEPLVQTSVGKMVSPDLPPLSGADAYLPENVNKFTGYIWPAKGVLTSGYGLRWGRMHRGIDIAGPVGTPIVAAAPGVVETSGWNSGGYGNLVEIRHPDGSLTLYAHNHRLLVRKGQQVAQGQQIAEMGSTGYSTGPHSHFEIHASGKGAVNPMAFLPR